MSLSGSGLGAANAWSTHGMVLGDLNGLMQPGLDGFRQPGWKATAF